jgi:hypothetical protein
MTNPNDPQDLATLDVLIEDLELAHTQIEAAEPSLGTALGSLKTVQEEPNEQNALLVEYQIAYRLSLVRDRMARAQTALAHAEALQRRFHERRQQLDEEMLAEAGLPSFGNNPRRR